MQCFVYVFLIFLVFQRGKNCCVRVYTTVIRGHSDG